MSKEERYKIRRIGKDCLFPDGLYELKDKESKFFLIIESKNNVEKIKTYLIDKDKQLQKKADEIAYLKLSSELDGKVIDALRQDIRTNTQQICDYIRQNITPHTGMFYHKCQKTISISRLDKILVKIEKGENKDE